IDYASGITVTGWLGTACPTGTFVSHSLVEAVEGAHDENDLTLHGMSDLRVNQIYLHNEDGQDGVTGATGQNCGGLAVTGDQNVTIVNAVVTAAGACKTYYGTSGAIYVNTSSYDTLNGYFGNTPNTGNSFDSTAVDYEGNNFSAAMRGDVIAADYGAGIESLAIHGNCGSDWSSASEFSDSLLVDNGTTGKVIPGQGGIARGGNNLSGDDGDNGGTVTYGPTTLVDTRKQWSTTYPNYWSGAKVTVGTHSGTVLTSNATTLTLTSSWSNGTPAPGDAYNVTLNGTGSGVSVAYSATGLSDTVQSWSTNVWLGAKVTAATGSYGYVSGNTGTGITTTGWSNGTPPAGTGYSVACKPNGSIMNNVYAEPSGAETTDGVGDFSGYSFSGNRIIRANAIDNVDYWNALVDYSASTQGSNGWTYQYRTSPTSVWTNFASACQIGTQAWDTAWCGAGAPSGGVGYSWQVPGNCPLISPCDVARTWTAPRSGSISVRGRVAKSDNSCGDGTLAKIEKVSAGTTSQLWPVSGWQPIINESNPIAGVEASLNEVSVAAGDVLHFEVDMNQDPTCDETSWSPTIAYTSLIAADWQFDSVNGSASGSGGAVTFGSTTMTDTSKTWTTNQWANATVATATSAAVVVSSTANSITVAAWRGGTPPAGTAYNLVLGKQEGWLANSGTVLAQVGGPSDYQLQMTSSSPNLPSMSSTALGIEGATYHVLHLKTTNATGQGQTAILYFQTTGSSQVQFEQFTIPTGTISQSVDLTAGNGGWASDVVQIALVPMQVSGTMIVDDIQLSSS
ncbi:MAG: hypothetical protein ACYDGR_04510, partial [Candidatus Dormibacteria bacterium]